MKWFSHSSLKLLLWQTLEKGNPRINMPLLVLPKISIIDNSVWQTLEKADPEKYAITFSSKNNH
jgi:hypothetical protein